VSVVVAAAGPGPESEADHHRFSQGDVIAIVPISFHDGAAHSALWD
jgi:hypothetical protein